MDKWTPKIGEKVELSGIGTVVGIEMSEDRTNINIRFKVSTDEECTVWYIPDVLVAPFTDYVKDNARGDSDVA